MSARYSYFKSQSVLISSSSSWRSGEVIGLFQAHSDDDIFWGIVHRRADLVQRCDLQNGTTLNSPELKSCPVGARASCEATGGRNGHSPSHLLAAASVKLKTSPPEAFRLTIANPSFPRGFTSSQNAVRYNSKLKIFYSLPPRNLRSGDIAFLCIIGRNYFMAAAISLKNLTEKQRKVWRMRYRKGWRMRRIALEMGMSAFDSSSTDTC